MSNIETLYYLHRATTPNTYYEALDLLQTMPIFNRGPQDIIVFVGKGGFIPVPTLNYVIIAATKIYAVSAGTYTISMMSTSANPATLYVMKRSSNDLSTYVLSGSAHAVRTQTLNITGNNEYTFVIVQTNSNMNNTMYMRFSYTGQRQPLPQAFVGGNGTVLQLSNSTVVAVGDYKWSARPADFDGWLMCDGREVYRDAYPALYSLIFTSFGSPTTDQLFKLPDARGRVCGGIGAGHELTNRILGDKPGTETHTLNTNQIPSHMHTYQDAYFAEHIPGSSNFGTNAEIDTDNGFRWRTQSGGYTSDKNDQSTFLNTGNTGSGNAHNIMQPTLFIGNLFICAEL